MSRSSRRIGNALADAFQEQLGETLAGVLEKAGVSREQLEQAFRDGSAGRMLGDFAGAAAEGIVRENLEKTVDVVRTSPPAAFAADFVSQLLGRSVRNVTARTLRSTTKKKGGAS